MISGMDKEENNLGSGVTDKARDTVAGAFRVLLGNN